MSETVVFARDGISIAITSNGTKHKVRITPRDGNTYEIVTSDPLPAIGSYVEVEYTTTGDNASSTSSECSEQDEGASGKAYGLVVGHNSETEFTILWCYNYNEFDSPQQRRLFGRGAQAREGRILTTDMATITNENVRSLAEASPPNQLEFVLQYPGTKLSRLSATTLRDIVKTVSWYRDLQSQNSAGKKRKVDIWEAPGHAALYASLYTNGSEQRRREMDAAALYLYGIPDMEEGALPYYKQLESLSTWSENLQRASLIE